MSQPSVLTTQNSTPSTADSISWDVARQDKRITALAQDKRGRIFAASEESGVWMRGTSRHSDHLWRRFTVQNSRQLADDNIYALTVDHQNRVWAGTASHGVSIFNGRSWKNYDVLQAPIGERIFDIAVCPTDGDVWIASNVGLTRYSVSKDFWTTLYPTSRLPFNHIAAIAFDAQGNLVVGTQTDGVLLAEAKNQYSKWRAVAAPDSALRSNSVDSGASGAGLPSNMTSDVLVARDGTIWVGTNNGLAWSRDKGQNWRWTRGADYNDKVKNRLDTAVLKPLFTAQAPTWSEDYISCLAEDGAGMLWVGHWRKGYEVYNPKTQKFVLNGAPDAPNAKSDDPQSSGDGDYVKCILPLSGQAPLIGRYGFGLTIAPRSFDVSATKTTVTKSAPTQSESSTQWLDVAAYPSVQQAPNLKELNALLKQLSAVPVQAPQNAPAVVSLDDDWTTRGDWLGRYGRYWADLCAMFAPSDYIWGAGSEPVNYYPRIGDNVPKGDGVRTFVSHMYTDNPNSLEIPATFLDTRIRRGYTTKEKGRRQSEIDDHGEVYPYEKDGPHLYVSLQVPPGMWTLSLYDWNKDGDASENRDRDYRISIRSHNREKSLEDITDFEQQPELARARLRDFRRGIWKRFLVVGPQELTVEVNKNYSHNTILAGVMLDELNEKPSPYFYTTEQSRIITVSQQKEVEKQVAEPASVRSLRLSLKANEATAAAALFNELDWMRLSNPQWWAQSSRRFYQPLTLWLQAAQKSAHDNNAPVAETKAISAQLATCYYALHLFDLWETQQRKTGLTPARDIEKALTWDGASQGNGDGYNTVVKYLAAQKQESSTRSTKALSVSAPSNQNTR